MDNPYIELDNPYIEQYLLDLRAAREKLMLSVAEGLEQLCSNLEMVKVDAGVDNANCYCLMIYHIQGSYKFPVALKLRGIEFYFIYRNEKDERKESDTYRDLDHLHRGMIQIARSIFNKRGHKLVEELGLFD